MLRGPVFFPLLLVLLILVTVTSFLLTGPLGWAVGILYIAYDTWLLGYVAFSTSRTLREAGGSAPPGSAPSLAVLIAARNEREALPACLDALDAQTDRPDEIWVIDDGSTDDTVACLTRRSDPRLKVWSKAHSGKSRSLNEVWPRAASEVVVTIDADTILEPDAIAAIRRAFGADTSLAAACGVLTPRCRPSFGGRAFEMFQTFEYIRAFLARLAWMRSDSLLLVSGAFAAYRKDALARIGGYDPLSLVEDYDLIHRLHRHAFDHGLPMRVKVIADARATTDAPNGIRAFLTQRRRWFSGFLQTQFKNRDMVGDPRYGTVGTLMLPIKTIDTLQPIYGLVAFGVLIYLVVCGLGPPRFLLWIIGVKLTLDLIFHFWSVYLYHRWQKEPIGGSKWALAALATIAEPLTFQLLRHVGALLGWIGFLKGTNDWAPQREPAMENAK